MPVSVSGSTTIIPAQIPHLYSGISGWPMSTRPSFFPPPRLAGPSNFTPFLIPSPHVPMPSWNPYQVSSFTVSSTNNLDVTSQCKNQVSMITKSSLQSLETVIIHTYVYTQIHIYACIHTYIYMHAYIHTYIRMYINI